MATQLRIVLWNANGLARHTEEIKTYIRLQNVDAMLISETHFTAKSSIRKPHYSIYDTQHPDGTAHGGTAIIIKKTLSNTTSTVITAEIICRQPASLLKTGSPHAHSPQFTAPKHVIKASKFLSVYSTPGPRFLAGETTMQNRYGAPD